MKDENIDEFPLSRERKIKGTRRLAREKCLQILIASHMSEVSPDDIFNHIYHRRFNFGDDKEKKSEKLLKPNEIFELEADIPIIWKEEDIEFGKKLIAGALENQKFVDELMKEFANNWEIDRIALIDRVIMHMTATEFIDFPDIPPKVSINEGIDIAKKYSTDKSGTFINGVLDSMYKRLLESNKIKKEGRGLLEN